MADLWVEASTALEICGDSFAICERCEAALIRSRAQLFKRHNIELVEADLPKEFWWATGHEALEQNWKHGDFSTWIDRSFHWQAFGVRFALEDLLKLLPVEQHASVRRRLSVAGNPAWVSSLESSPVCIRYGGAKSDDSRCSRGGAMPAGLHNRTGSGNAVGARRQARRLDDGSPRVGHSNLVLGRLHFKGN